MLAAGQMAARLLAEKRQYNIDAEVKEQPLSIKEDLSIPIADYI